MKRTLLLLCLFLSLYTPVSADVDIQPSQVLTLDAWKQSGPGAMLLRSDRARIMLLRFGGDPPPQNVRAWLHIHVASRTNPRRLHIDVFGLTREWGLESVWADFARSWYEKTPLAFLRLGDYYGAGWYRCRLGAGLDFQHHRGNYGFVLLPLSEGVSVGYSIDRVFLRLDD